MSSLDTTIIGEPDLKLGGGYIWVPVNRTTGVSAQVVRITIATSDILVIDLTDGDIGCYAGCWNPDNECFYTVDCINGRPYKITKAGSVTRGDAITNGSGYGSGLEVIYAAGSIWTVGENYLTELDPDTLEVLWQGNHTYYQRQILYANGYIWSGGWNYLRRVDPATHATADFNLNITVGGGEVFCGAVSNLLLWFAGPNTPDAAKMNKVDSASPSDPVTPTEIDISGLDAGLTGSIWPHNMCSDGELLFIGFWDSPNVIAIVDVATVVCKGTLPAGDMPTAAGKVHGMAIDMSTNILYWAKADVAQECYVYWADISSYKSAGAGGLATSKMRMVGVG